MKVLKITAVWCPACIVMNLRWPKIMRECDWVEVEEYDYDADIEIKTKYNIGKDLPVFIFLDQAGNEIMRLIGEIDRKDLIKHFEEHKDK